MLKSHYDLENKKCKDCDCLVAPDEESVKAHSCTDFRKPLDNIHKKYQVFPKTKPIFKVGEEVEATMIGKIVSITSTEDGSIVYRLSSDDAHGYFKESQVVRLLSPDDLDMDYCGIGDI